MVAMSVLLVFFLAAYVYRLTVTQQKAKAAIYPLVAVGVIILLGYILSLVYPRMGPSIGTLTGMISVFTGIGAVFSVPKEKIAPTPVTKEG